MAEQSFFQKALGNFIHEFANGDLIRHYADQGYSIKEIRGKLDFPTPENKIQEMVWKHFLQNGKILAEKPGSGNKERYEYVKDISSYGKTSYRRVKVEDKENSSECFSWRETTIKEVKEIFYRDSDVQPSIFYAEISFGLLRYKDQEKFESLLKSLTTSEVDYIEGLFKERSRVYYKLDYKMTEILDKLCNRDMYGGKIYQGMNSSKK